MQDSRFSNYMNWNKKKEESCEHFVKCYCHLEKKCEHKPDRCKCDHKWEHKHDKCKCEHKWEHRYDKCKCERKWEDKHDKCKCEHKWEDKHDKCKWEHKEEKCHCKKEDRYYDDEDYYYEDDKFKKHKKHHCKGCICHLLRCLSTGAFVDVILAGGGSFAGVYFISLDSKTCCATFFEVDDAAASPLIIDCQQIIAIRSAHPA
ncbi:hypothetical protein [Lysinibacillus cavernae]|uniref:hypothetical protein n=1 Tax=Lysinibacillus cavernae TaxID=2666135 RepID=UPI0012D93DDA|nr:hypothetical protein [Lysinibacillus cavernae]